MLPFRWVFPLEFAQLQKFPRDMPTGQPDLDSSSLRLSFQVTLDCGLLTKLAITVPVLFNVVFHVVHVCTNLEKKRCAGNLQKCFRLLVDFYLCS